MKKSEAESAIRHLCHVWGDEVGMPRAAESEPSFFAFKSWVDQKGYGHYLNFRSVRGASADAELWFDEEFKQQWRN
jgi:hypothetical protein